MESFKKVAQELLDEMTGMLSVADEKVFTSLVNDLLASKHIVASGSGRSRYVLGTFVRRVSRIGRKAALEGEAVAGRASRGDVLLGARGAGERGPVTALAEQARKRGARVYTFVGETSSLLASHGDYVIPLAPQTRTPFETITNAGRASHLAFDEALLLYLDAALIALQEVMSIDAKLLADDIDG
jgi:D-arabinose 5-phosphate isomerase GutQ